MKTKSRLIAVFLIFLAIALAAVLGIKPLYYLYRDVSYYFGERTQAEQTVKAFAAENRISYGRYPEDLIELLEINPETEEFVLNYPFRQEMELDLSGYSRDTVPLFLQWDPMWGYEKYGSGCIGQTGCGPTCLAMAGYYLTGDDRFNPKAMADFAAENGYDCAMQMDADGQHKPEYIAEMLAALEEGSDIVIGSRFLTVKKPKTLRMVGSYIISWSIRLTTGRAICDPTSGMRMFNRAMVQEFAENLNYGPEPDTISYLIKNGAKVKEVQVKMGERTAGQSYLTLWRSVQYMVKMSVSILLIQWFRKRDTETPYPERSL